MEITEWHPTNVNNFLQCQRSALHSLTAHGKGEPAPPTYEMFRGTAVHLVLEHLAKNYTSYKRSIEKAEHIIECQPWQEHFDFENVDDSRMKDLKKDALHLVRNYFELENMEDQNILYTEQTMILDIYGVPFVGTIDRVDKIYKSDALMGPGSRYSATAIVDYKTGSYKHNDEWRQDARRQICLYALAYREFYGVAPEDGYILWLGGDTPVKEHVSINNRRLHKAYTQLSETYIRAMREENKPMTSPLCGWCSYWSSCPEGTQVIENRIIQGQSVSSAVRVGITNKVLNDG